MYILYKFDIPKICETETKSFKKKFLTFARIYAIIISERGKENRQNQKGKKKMEWNEMYDVLTDYVGVDKKALDLAFAVGGCNEETAERILFYYTGWKSFEGYLGEINGEN